MVKIKKTVLAYSGGLDTSVILKWLIEAYKCEVITFSADIGQEEELKGLKEKAKKTGASKVYIDDLKEEFIKDFVFPMFRANAVYEGDYLLGTAIARPLIAKRQIEIAKKEKADAVSHGATGKGNDQVRFEIGYIGLNPDIKIIAPWREWDLNSRTKLLDFAKKHKIKVPQTKKKPYSMDRNMLHMSYEGGILEDTWESATDDMYTMTIPPEKAPDKPEIIEISFKEGDPVAINGKKLSPANLFKKLNEFGKKNGIGRIDIVENRFIGMKSRGVYETPGGTILKKAHMAIESITLDKEVMHLRDDLVPRYARMIYNGFWFSPERILMQKLIDETQKNVSGDVRLKLYKGGVYILGRKSENSIYNKNLATFEEDEVYNQMDATGFIKLNALRLKLKK